MIAIALNLNHAVFTRLAENVTIARLNYSQSGSDFDRYEVARHERLLTDALCRVGACE